jgi:hypothetical protein
MGTIVHKAIIVTSYDERSIMMAHRQALVCFTGTACRVTPVTEEGINGYRSFMVATDGSKLGWRGHKDADIGREAYKTWLKAEHKKNDALLPRDMDFAFAVEWLEVVYGECDEWMISESNGDLITGK